MSPHKPHLVPADLARAVSNYLTRVDRGKKGNGLRRFVQVMSRATLRIFLTPSASVTSRLWAW